MATTDSTKDVLGIHTVVVHKVRVITWFTCHEAYYMPRYIVHTKLSHSNRPSLVETVLTKRIGLKKKNCPNKPTWFKWDRSTLVLWNRSNCLFGTPCQLWRPRKIKWDSFYSTMTVWVDQFKWINSSRSVQVDQYELSHRYVPDLITWTCSLLLNL